MALHPIHILASWACRIYITVQEVLAHEFDNKYLALVLYDDRKGYIGGKYLEVLGRTCLNIFRRLLFVFLQPLRTFLRIRSTSVFSTIPIMAFYHADVKKHLRRTRSTTNRVPYNWYSGVLYSVIEYSPVPGTLE
jgi:hypothetical protein